MSTGNTNHILVRSLIALTSNTQLYHTPRHLYNPKPTSASLCLVQDPHNRTEPLSPHLPYTLLPIPYTLILYIQRLWHSLTEAQAIPVSLYLRFSVILGWWPKGTGKSHASLNNPCVPP